MIKSTIKYILTGLLMMQYSSLHSFLDIKKINQNTAFNCGASNIVVNVKGDQNVIVIAVTCIFIAGAATPQKRIDTAGFNKINVSEGAVLPFSTLLKGIEFSPTEYPQKGYTIDLIATLDPIDQLPATMKNEYKKQGITHGLQIWRAAKFKSALLGGTSTTQATFTLLHTLPATSLPEGDTISIAPDGEVILDNIEGTITIPTGLIKS
jgi:hypothetical protein